MEETDHKSQHLRRLQLREQHISLLQPPHFSTPSLHFPSGAPIPLTVFSKVSAVPRALCRTAGQIAPLSGPLLPVYKKKGLVPLCWGVSQRSHSPLGPSWLSQTGSRSWLCSQTTEGASTCPRRAEMQASSSPLRAGRSLLTASAWCPPKSCQCQHSPPPHPISSHPAPPSQLHSG